MTEARCNLERQNDDSNEPGIEEFNEYEIEKILDHGRHKKQLQYKEEFENQTWEPESESQLCTVLSFLKNIGIHNQKIKYQYRENIKIRVAENDHGDLIF